MKKLNGFLIIFLIFLGSCQSGTQKATITGGIITIDISKDYPNFDKNEEDIIADTEYVPLETNKDILIDKYAKLHTISEKHIVVTERGGGDIFIFDRSGKIVSHISRKGKGPEEYSAMPGVVFDEKNREIFVFDNIGTGRVVVYSLTGEYRRTLKYSTDFNLMHAYNFDDETMLVYDTKGLYKNAYSKEPYMFMSKKDGDITSILNISFPARYDTKVYTSFKNSSGQDFTYSSSIGIPNRRHYGQDFIISDVSSDTIYLLNKNRDLTPFIVRTPSVHATDPHLVCTTPLITDKYIFLYITTLDYNLIQKEKAPPAKTLVYEFETGKISTIPVNITTDLKILQKNVDARLIDATVLKDAYERKKLTGKLEQLAAALDEEDNPVVQITKFK